MTEVQKLHSRADALRKQGLTPHQVHAYLVRAFPNMERDIVVNASRIDGYHRGITPGWALWGQPLRPTQIRFKMKPGAPLGQPRKPKKNSLARNVQHEHQPTEHTFSGPFKKVNQDFVCSFVDNEEEDEEMDFPTIRIQARDVQENDYVDDLGVVYLVQRMKGYVTLFFMEVGSKLYAESDSVRVRLEDDGL